jgi:heme A synthase
MIAILLTIVFWGIIFYVLWWALARIALPEPFNKIATVLLVVATVVVLIGILNGEIHPFPFLTGRL